MKTLSWLLFACGGFPAMALVVSQQSLDRALGSAALVAEITVESRQTVAHPTLMQMTTARARIDRLIQIRDDGGPFPRAGDTVDIQVPGGELAGVGMMVSGIPRPYVGHRYRAYLNRVADRTFRPIGFERGMQPLAATRAYTRNRTDGSNGDGTGPFLFWDASFFPIPYYLSAPTFQNLTAFAAAVDASLATWSAPGDVKISFVAMGCTSITHNANDGLNNIILVTDSWPFDPDAIAITRNFYVADDSDRAGLILDTDILLNGVDHAFTTTNELGKHDVQNIVTHESGHFIGLGHETDPIDTNATMYAVASPNEFNKRTLKADDLAGLHAAYAGVGTKMVPTHSIDNCALVSSDANLGCAAVHRRRANPGAWEWLAGTVILIWGMGRWVQRSGICEEPKATRQSRWI